MAEGRFRICASTDPTNLEIMLDQALSQLAVSQSILPPGQDPVFSFQLCVLRDDGQRSQQQFTLCSSTTRHAHCDGGGSAVPSTIPTAYPASGALSGEDRKAAPQFATAVPAAECSTAQQQQPSTPPAPEIASADEAEEFFHDLRRATVAASRWKTVYNLASAGGSLVAKPYLAATGAGAGWQVGQDAGKSMSNAMGLADHRR
jgi:hypothetical protein